MYLINRIKFVIQHQRDDCKEAYVVYLLNHGPKTTASQARDSKPFFLKTPKQDLHKDN